MNPKSLLSAVLLLATLILLAPSVHSCVNFFAAQGITNGKNQDTWLNAKIWDNGGGPETTVCNLSEYPNGAGVYPFSCNAGYSGSFNIDQAYSGTVTYGTPNGAKFTFVANCLGPCDCDGCNMWQACAYDCDSKTCFVPGCGIDYNGCGPK